MPNAPPPVWHGTSQEAYDLSVAITHNCTCSELQRRCPSHELMLDQHWLDYLLFLRWLYWKEHVCKSER